VARLGWIVSVVVPIRGIIVLVPATVSSGSFEGPRFRAIDICIIPIVVAIIPANVIVVVRYRSVVVGYNVIARIRVVIVYVVSVISSIKSRFALLSTS
jgi:hypothetical protein